MTLNTAQLPAEADELPRAKKVQRMFYLDNLRLLFTILVILHHICLTYTGEQGWYYYDRIEDPFTDLVMILLMTVNRNWVLHCFFLISGYFTPGSLDKKGLWIYIRERLIRIGIPLAIFAVFIRPPLFYFLHRDTLSQKYSFIESMYTLKFVAPGPAWFLEVLLVFSIIYGLIWILRKPRESGQYRERPFPRNSTIFLFIFALTIFTFVFRIFLPAEKQIFHLRLGNYADYVAFFAIGILGYRNKWLNKLTDRTGLQWTIITAVAIAVYGAFTISSWMSHESLSYLRGGMSVKTFITTWIGAHIAVGTSISFIYLFRKYVNVQPSIIRIMTAEAYAVFIFHAPIVVAITYAIHSLTLWPFLKFTAAFTLSTIFCFLICRYVVRKIPFSDRIL